MSELKAINLLRRCAIPELCGKNFFIPDYQRGYRWGEVQVRQFMEDLYSFVYGDGAKGDFYCLQPVVVKEMPKADVERLKLQSPLDDNRWYEVIDGQQRLTTIRIILALKKSFSMFNNFSFSIHYQTRPALGSLFDRLRALENTADGKFVLDKNAVEDYTDIDSWHIKERASQILKWFQGGRKPGVASELDKFAGSFYETFVGRQDDNRSVQVIWYELCDGSDPLEIFKRLNDKKVSLNNAELIRGMFLSDSAVFRTDPELLKQFDQDVQPIIINREQARKQSHIIELWDLIENTLRDDRFWAFINPDNDKTAYSCRIEYLFDLISRKEAAERDSLYTYLEFDRMLSSGECPDLWDLWKKVETCYFTLRAWYANFDYFHWIGYLVAVEGVKALVDLLDKSATLYETSFRREISKKIKATIADRKDTEGKRSILDYSYENDYELLKKVLFLYNVESMRRQRKDPFPFDKYKNIKNWTLEHIHAQNSEQIDRSDKEKWNAWFGENVRSLRLLQSRRPDDTELCNVADSIANDYDRLKNNPSKFSFRDMARAFDQVLAYFNALCREEDRPSLTHDISNMALLDGINNSSISNSVFEVKRQMILQSDARGDYIPLCTRNVFLKYYNRNNPDFTVGQNFYWSETDRINYRNDISEVMSEYLWPARKETEPENEL